MARLVKHDIKRIKRKKIFSRVFFVSLILLSVLSLFTALFFYIDRFKIKNITIEGATDLSKEFLTQELQGVLKSKSLGIFPRDRILFFPYDDVRVKLMNSFKKFSSVQIEGRFSQNLLLKVKERQPIAVFCADEQKSCYFIDESGFIFNDAPFFSSGVFPQFIDNRAHPKPSIGDFLIEGEEARRIFDFMKLMPADYSVAQILLENDGVYKFLTEEGWQIILQKDDDFRVAHQNFLASLSEIKDKRKNLDYIDLRFGGKVFFKFK
ncbi:MAG: hypothetical protein Q7R75_01195 [bacterium]|nr:hypothetical protein [bacterium]